VQFEGKNIIYNQALINKLKAELNVILEKANADDDLIQAQNELLRHITPNHWNLNYKNNQEKTIELNFEEFMLAVKDQTTEDLENITTFRFYTLIDYIKNKNNGR